MIRLTKHLKPLKVSDDENMILSLLKKNNIEMMSEILKAKPDLIKAKDTVKSPKNIKCFFLLLIIFKNSLKQ